MDMSDTQLDGEIIEILKQIPEFVDDGLFVIFSKFLDLFEILNM